MALSLDLRKRIIEAYQNQEGSIRKLAERFKIAPSTVWELLKKYATTHQLQAESPPGRTPTVGQKELRVLEKLLQKKNDLTLAELQKRLCTATAIEVGITTIHRACQRIKVRYKKNPISR